ncbi:MAG: hypothetical protein M0R66_02505 [Candidatus Omnitrophica bacterium]|nr:hypothetical protein [Candidatus Omnitrophota bacterium]
MTKDLVVPKIEERTRRQVLRRLGTRTPRQIADEMGVTPDVVLAVKRDIVDSMDALTVDEHVAKAFVDLQEVVGMAMSEFQSTEDARSKAPLLSAAVTATKTTLQMLEKWASKNSGAVETLNKKRQSELITLMQRTVDSGVEEIAETYDLDKQELFDVFNRKLVEAAMDMESRNALGD